MAITAAGPSSDARSFKMGDFVAQMMDVAAVSGATSGTVTSTSVAELQHIILPAGFTQTAAPVFSGNAAVLAFTVPTETAASRTIDGVLYTAVANKGAGGNSITIQLVDGTGDTPAVTKGTETVAVSGNAIVVHIDPTSVSGSARSDVKAAVIASSEASALVTPSTVTAGTTVAAVTAATPLQSGVSGGAAGVALCLGRP